MFYQENASENVVCKILAILSEPTCTHWPPGDLNEILLLDKWFAS